MRKQLIKGWADTLIDSCSNGTFGKPFQVRAYYTRGPRAAIVDIDAGRNSVDALKAFAAASCINLRRTIKWRYARGPFVYVNGPYVRIEVSWPDGLEADAITLDSINNEPGGDGRWVTGQLQNGTTHLLQLSETVPHYLFSGGTGGGKSTGMRSLVKQLARDNSNQIILLDGKGGEGLGCVAGCQNMVGPMATDIPDMRAALQWALLQMEHRYENEPRWPKFLDEQKRIVIVFDEFQELTALKIGDPVITEAIRGIAVKARAAKIHLVLGTQTPNLDMFGHHTTRKQISGRVAFWMESQQASAVALGVQDPSAHTLTGKGDGYALTPGSYARRVQFAWVEREQLRRDNQFPPMMEDWPAFDAEAMKPIEGFNVEQLATGLEVVAQGSGRPALESAAGVGSTRAKKLLRVSRELWSSLQKRGFNHVE